MSAVFLLLLMVAIALVLERALFGVPRRNEWERKDMADTNDRVLPVLLQLKQESTWQPKSRP